MPGARRVGGFQEARLRRLAESRAELPDTFCPEQYSNPDNPRACAMVAERLSHALGSARPLAPADDSLPEGVVLRVPWDRNTDGLVLRVGYDRSAFDSTHAEWLAGYQPRGAVCPSRLSRDVVRAPATGGDTGDTHRKSCWTRIRTNRRPLQG